MSGRKRRLGLLVGRFGVPADFDAPLGEDFRPPRRAPSRFDVLKELRRNRARLRRYGVRRLGLFGSVARGEGRAESDLDFVVELERKTFDDSMGLKFCLEDIFHRDVDLILADAIKAPLRKAILSEVVYVEGDIVRAKLPLPGARVRAILKRSAREGKIDSLLALRGKAPLRGLDLRCSRRR